MMDGDVEEQLEHTLFPPQVALGHDFATALETLTKMGSLTIEGGENELNTSIQCSYCLLLLMPCDQSHDQLL